MNRLLASAVTGALAMYFLDPSAGRRRRARTRDRAGRMARKAADAYEVTLRDVRHRAQGLQAMGQRLLRRADEVSDPKLVGRVRAVLGRYVSHPHAIEVSAASGHVTLSGPILAGEVHSLVHAVKQVPGVCGATNRLEVHNEPGKVSALQGGVPRRGQRFELLQDNWSPSARVAVGGIGLALLIRSNPLYRLGGAALLARAITNLDFATLLGFAGPGEGIEVQKTIHVNAPVDKVFAFWSHYESFPHFMSRVRDVHLAGNRSHWVVRGPAGVAVEWTSEVTQLIPETLIAWRATTDSEVKHAGEVRFAPEDGGTRLMVRLYYLPPAGALGHAVASLFGADAKSEMDADLMRMKTSIESGHAPHDAAQPA